MLFSCEKEQNINLEKDYSKGFYLSQNGKHTEAFSIMQKLAKHNYPPAVQNIALSYYHGLGVKKNQQLAEDYFLKAHNLGILDATNELANIYYDRQNIKKAENFWKIASDGGDEYASFNLAMFYFETKNNKTAYKYLLKAQELGHPKADDFIKKQYTK
jgi:TPR repeat protein